MSADLTPGSGGEALGSTRSMAVGTLVSRGTGFIRTVVLAAAIGTLVGDAYNAANTLPNIVYELLLGGVLTSVVVPLLVAAAKREGDGGEAYGQRLLTLVVLGLGAATLLAVLFAPEIIRAYLGSGADVQRRVQLGTTFARFLLPEIFFYGVGALLAGILNVRNSFAAPMWAPVVNNVVVILTGLVFIVVTRTTLVQQGALSSGQILLLGGGTALGIVAQTLALLPALRRVGFRMRLRLDVRGVGLAQAGRLAGWVFVYVLANQAAYLVISRLAFASKLGGIDGGAYSVYTYAFTLVLLPHAVVAVSIITALLPQMSRKAADGHLHDVAGDLASGIKLSCVILVPAAATSIVLGPLIGTVVFAHHAITLPIARLIGATLAAYAVSLIPFSAFQLQLRAFYALHDTRTPALVNIVLAIINVAADVVFFVSLPTHEQVVGLAAGYSVSYFVGYAWLSVLLRRRLGTPPRPTLARTVTRLSAASAVAAGAAYVTARAVTSTVGLGDAGALIGLVAALAVGGPLYMALIRRMRIPEIDQVHRLLRGRLPAPSAGIRRRRP